jgi:predicted ester cyclase
MWIMRTSVPVADNAHMNGGSVLERWLAAGDAAEIDRFSDFLDPQVVVHAPFGLSTIGIEAEKQVWRDAIEAMPDIRHEVQAVAVAGATVAARVVVTGTHERDFGGIKALGRTFRFDQALFADVRDTKIVEAWEIVDTASLMRQLGALPE